MFSFLYCRVILRQTSLYVMKLLYGDAEGIIYPGLNKFISHGHFQLSEPLFVQMDWQFCPLTFVSQQDLIISLLSSYLVI